MKLRRFGMLSYNHLPAASQIAKKKNCFHLSISPSKKSGPRFIILPPKKNTKTLETRLVFSNSLSQWTLKVFFLKGWFSLLKYEIPKSLPSRELTYPPYKAYLKMIFLFPRSDMLVSWRVSRLAIGRLCAKDFFVAACWLRCTSCNICKAHGHR